MIKKKDRQEATTGVFTGKFTSDRTIEGTWAKARGGDALPLSLTEVDTTAPADFRGFWVWTKSREYLGFERTLTQRGNKLGGEYLAVLGNEYGALQKSTRQA